MPANPDTSYLLGRLYNEEAYRSRDEARYRELRLEQAGEAFRESLRRAPARGRTWFELGWTEANLGRDAEADRLFSLALTLEPHWANLRANYALYLVSRSRIDDALVQIEAARELEPGLAPMDALSIIGPHVKHDVHLLRRAAGSGPEAELALETFDLRDRGKSPVSELQNLDEATVRSFGRQWARFDQSKVPEETLRRMFSEYFAIFPWERLPEDAVGADIGCGAGRFSRFAAERASVVHCIDASDEALSVARHRLSSLSNVVLHRCSIDALPFEEGSLDFAYSLGVLHHVPDTAAAFKAIARTLKKDAPFLVYLYYAFENRPSWYRFLWRLSDRARSAIARLPPAPQSLVLRPGRGDDLRPLARFSRVLEAVGIDIATLPLSIYRNRDFYSMRTDARDRFGTPLEKRFRADEIRRMMNDAGLAQVRFSDRPPYWCAVGIKS